VSIGFDDVAGLKAAKDDLQEVVEFLKAPEKFRRLGGKVPRGVLLVGPPGTGKTLLARAVAGESGVPFYSISASEFMELFVGVGAARVRELFEEAKKNAPAIVFIDEIDAVGRSRGIGYGGGHDEREQTLNQLLSEMDGFDRNDLTIVLAATNRPDVLDPALLRPGRFDRRVVVDRPEVAARQAILEVHTKGKPIAPDVDLQALAECTPGFSGADLANWVNEAALAATRRSADAIAERDFAYAFDKIVLGDPREAKLDPEEKRRIAGHEAGHALVALLSPGAEPVKRVSIIPRGTALGVTQQTPLSDRHLLTKSQLETKLCVLLGGYAAEQLIFGETSSGAENDLKEATHIASTMVSRFGMSEKLGPAYYELSESLSAEPPLPNGLLSDATSRAIESETSSLLLAARARATKILEDRRSTLERLMAKLIKDESIESAALLALMREEPTSNAETSVAVAHAAPEARFSRRTA
jgi:cell division protease FtsH